MTQAVPPSVVIENGPALWDTILARFPPGAVIAGGAVRDYLLGVPAKDVDVFLRSIDWPSSGFNGFASLADNLDAEYAAMQMIEVVQHGRIAGAEVDVIGVHLPDGFSAERLIAQFDFGLTRCWYDGELHDTPEAAADRAAHTVSLLINDRPERALKRWARFNERMGGGWPLVQA